MLEHDCHLLGVHLEEAARHPHARRSRGKFYVEVVRPRKPSPRDLGEHLANHAAQRVLRQDVVTDQIVSHSGRCSPAPPGPPPWRKKWRLLLPGASEPRLKGANPPGLDFRC